MKFTAYAMSERPLPLVPARADRDWMDRTPERFAYRCLPLAIANSFGWEVQSPCAFAATWNGESGPDAIRLRALDGEYPLASFVDSHFGSGVLTFHTGYLFRTEAEWDTLVTGAYNHPKDGIYPLTGVIETDWLPFTFTMNWRFTRPGRIEFAKGEPLCVVYPVRKDSLDVVEPEIRDFADAPADFRREFEAWRDGRANFTVKLKAGDAEVVKQGWQRHYFKGEKPTDDARIPDHKSKLRLPTPVDLRGAKDRS